MKTAIEDIKKYSTGFKKHFWQYLFLFLCLDFFNQYLLIPFSRFLNTYLFQVISVPFSSLQFIDTIITHHPFVCIALVIEVLFYMWLIYLEFAILLIGINSIRAACSLKKFLKEVQQAVKPRNFSAVLLVLLYTFLVIPVAEVIFRTPLLSKIQMGEFIWDYMTRKIILGGILLLFYLLIIIVGARLIFTLPKMILKQEKFKAAFAESWQMTKRGGYWKTISKILLLLLLSTILLVIFYLGCYLLQLLWDVFPGQFSFIMANINLFLIQVVSALTLAWFMWVCAGILVKPLKLKQKKYSKKHRRSNWILWVTILFLISSFGLIKNNSWYLDNTETKQPLIISHRGVNGNNGVQNTIPALKDTVKSKPDLVEMDLHETKDKKFVVLHDANLSKLTGINKKPSQLTLKKLTSLMAYENGHRAKIVSFDHYLDVAKKDKQRLLIEIKTTPADSKQMLEDFNRKYGKIILNRNYQIHSINYQVITKLHKINPELPVFYIQPYNFIYPTSLADGYSMEYSTLNPDFIRQAHKQKKAVYVWTVDNPNVMKKMLYDHVDGLITNNLEEAKVAVRQYEHNLSYANYLLNYIMTIPI